MPRLSCPAFWKMRITACSGLLRMMLTQLQGELRQLQGQIDEADALIAKAAKEQEAC